MKKHFLATLLIGLIFTQAQAQDTIRVGHKFKDFKQLEMGTVTDLIHNKIQGRTIASLKTRTSEMVNIEGEKVLKITHQWVSLNSQKKEMFEFFCEPETLKPIQHIRTTTRNGKESFLFQEGKISAIDSVSGGTNTDFSIDLKEATYNWEIDLETYSLLPMKSGATFVMNFYHPGGSAEPDFYTLNIEGSERLALADGTEMDCWIIYTDYKGKQETRFWYTKKGQNFVKMEGSFNGMLLKKTRLYQ